ncbi:MAG: DUF2063 domain-containing protein [Hyphomicrobiales bacterium]|nr:DUF2063 domain-containing protein [Hyphomicrobiales bacterium]
MLVEPDDAEIDPVTNNFSEIQIFAEALRDPDKDIPEGVIGPDKQPAPKRFSVYRNNVALSLREALEQTYPGVRKIVGVDNFNILSSVYFSRHPPSTPMMHSYGEMFPGFLNNFEPLQHSPFLVDLAWVEKYWIDAYHASDKPVLDGAELGKIDTEQLIHTRFNPHPASAVIPSHYQLHDLFLSRDEEGECNVSYERADSAQAVLITRPLLDVMVNKLGPAETEFFNTIINNSTLGECVEKAMELDADFDVSAAIALMLSTGTMCDLSNSNLSGQ